MTERLKLAVLVDVRTQCAGSVALRERLLAVLDEAAVPCGVVGADAAAAETWIVDTLTDDAEGPVYAPRTETDPPVRLRPSWAATPTWFGNEPHLTLLIPYAVDLSDRAQALPLGWTPDEWLQYLMDAFDRLEEEAQSSPRLLVLLLHPELSGRAGAVQALQQFLRYVAERDGVGWSSPMDLAMEVRKWL